MKQKYIYILIAFCSTLNLTAQQIQNQWITSAGSLGWDVVTDMAICPSGDIYLLGAFYDSIYFKGAKLNSEGSRDIFIAKYTSEGKCESSFSFGGIGFDYPIKIRSIGQEKLVAAFKHNQSVKIAGGEVPPLNTNTYSIAWINQGNKVSCINSIGSSGKSELTDLVVATDSTLWISGWFEDTLYVAGKNYIAHSEEDMYLAQYSKSGTLQWFKQFSGNGKDRALVLCSGARDVMFISGITSRGCFGKEFAPDSAKKSGDFLFLAQVNPSGEVKDVSFAANGLDIIPVGMVEMDSVISISASFGGTVKINNEAVNCRSKREILLFTHKKGTKKWEFQHWAGDLVATPISLNKFRDGIILTGSFAGTVEFSGNKFSTSGRGSDVFMLTIASNGTIDKSFVMKGNGFNFPAAIALQGPKVYVAGEFPDSLETEAGSLKSIGKEDVFISQYINCYLTRNIGIEITKTKLGGLTYFDLKAEKGYASYCWNDTGCKSPDFSTTLPGTYKVEVTDDLGCRYNRAAKVSEEEVNLADNILSNNPKFSIYPTVTNKMVYWEPDGNWSTDTPITISVYNSAGSEIIHQTYEKIADSQRSIDLSRATNGAYYIKFTGQNFEQKSKVIVLK